MGTFELLFVGAFVVFTTLLGLGGLFILTLGAAKTTWNFLRAQSIDDADTGSVVRATAPVEPIGDLVTPPSGSDCVGYAIETEQRRRLSKKLPIPKWYTDYVIWNIPEFALKDTTQEIRVNPDLAGDETKGKISRPNSPADRDSDIQLTEDEKSQRYDADEPPPPLVPDSIREQIGYQPHRYREYRLEPGEEVLVVGRLQGFDSRHRTISNTDGEIFLLSVKGYRSTLWVLLSRTIVNLFLSLVCFIPAFLVILLYLFVS